MSLERHSLLAQYAATNRFRAGRPTQVTIAPTGGAVLFLRSGPRDLVQDLFEHDPITGQERLLMSARQLLGETRENLSPEERARRERMRLAAQGLSSFELSGDGQHVLAPLGSRWFVLDRSTGTTKELIGEGGAPLDAHFSPSAEYVGCVRGGELCVIHVPSGSPERLTFSASTCVTNGIAEFVAQEEMHRMRGYWWSPDSRQLAYAEVDESNVEIRYLTDPSNPTTRPEPRRYPRAGTPNAQVRLGIISVTGGATTWVPWDQERYPYLATVAWPKQGPLTLVVQNREQTEEVVLRVDPATGRTFPLLLETDPFWLNLDQTFPYWLGEETGFLWMTERHGHRQLELRSPNGELRHTLTEPEHGFRKLLAVVENGIAAWGLASPDATQTHLTSVLLTDPYEVRLFPGPSERSDQTESVCSQQSDLLVQSLVTDETMPRWLVRRHHNGSLGEVISELKCTIERPLVPLHRQFISVGTEPLLNASIVRPQDFEAKRRYPVIVFTYGGPGAQVVKVGRLSYLLDQWIADQGFVVVSIDGRGTPGRGRTFERAIKGDLATAPLEDQVTGLHELGRRFSELDLSAVGIFGWSFGGYLAAMAVLRRADVFHAAVCGAPVVDLADYDTHYTERYLGSPHSAPEAYRVSSLHTYASHLTRPLLLIHGTADDNCYFSGSLGLADRLFRAGNGHDFLPLVGQTHMVTDPEVTCRMYQEIIQFFRKHLASPGVGLHGAITQS